jgi:hypothetical protein
VSVIDQLANGNITDWKHFEKMNVIPFLQTCYYSKAKHEEAIAAAKKKK